jgi:hypothetical protein
MARPSLTPAVALPLITTERALRRLEASLALRLEPIHRQPRAADAVLGTIEALLQAAEAHPRLIDETLPFSTANRLEPAGTDTTQAMTGLDLGFSLGELIGGLLTDAMFHRDDATVTASRIRTFFLQAADSARLPKSAAVPSGSGTDAEFSHGYAG